VELYLHSSICRRGVVLEQGTSYFCTFIRKGNAVETRASSDTTVQVGDKGMPRKDADETRASSDTTVQVGDAMSSVAALNEVCRVQRVGAVGGTCEEAAPAIFDFLL
jgi:hypothetical protein